MQIYDIFTVTDEMKTFDKLDAYRHHPGNPLNMKTMVE